jgi:hypothetical protein
MLRRFAEPTECLRNTLDSPLVAGHAYPVDASAGETAVQSAASARPSTASAASSWQKLTI